MTTEIRVACSPGEARVAQLRDGVLTDYAVWRPGSPDGVGDIHRGRVIKPVRAMAGAFVAIDGAEGFLPDSEGAKGLSDGDAVIVRVTRAAQGGKGPRLSARITEPDEAAWDGGVAWRPDAAPRKAAVKPNPVAACPGMSVPPGRVGSAEPGDYGGAQSRAAANPSAVLASGA